MRMHLSHRLHELYDALLDALGPSRWWPAQTPLEVIAGAVLTQNTAWKNVEKALANLLAAGALDWETLLALPEADLAELIRPSGFYRIKARRLHNVLEFFQAACGFDLSLLAKEETEALRGRLLEIRGIGRETADSILLYALNRPSFVVDAYTWRLLNRHSLVGEDAEYEELRELFMTALPKDALLYNEYHALIVRAAKTWCHKAKPLCGQCPLGGFLE